MIRRNLTSGLPLIHLLFAFVTHGADLIDDDGLVHIRGRLTPEAGAVVQRALEAATDQLYRESAQAPAGDRVQDEVTAGQRRADALVRVAECALAGDIGGRTAGDQYQVVVHADAAVLGSGSAPGATGSRPRSPIPPVSLSGDHIRFITDGGELARGLPV